MSRWGKGATHSNVFASPFERTDDGATMTLERDAHGDYVLEFGRDPGDVLPMARVFMDASNVRELAAIAGEWVRKLDEESAELAAEREQREHEARAATLEEG